MAAEQDFFVGNTADFNQTRGYLMGFFMPEDQSLLRRDDLEIAVMQLPERDVSKPHFHRDSTEVTYVIRGSLRLNIGIPARSLVLAAGEFMVIPPGTVLQNPTNDPGTEVLVIKFPSVPGDKFYYEEPTFSQQ